MQGEHDHDVAKVAAGQEAEPVAYMIRETRAGVRKTLCGKVYMRKEPAEAAARRMSNYWRTCEAFPVFEGEPRLAVRALLEKTNG